MLQMRVGDVGGPQRSLYVSADSRSTCMCVGGALPVERQTSFAVSPGGSGKRLSIAFTPPCCGVSKSPITTGPAPLSIVTSSIWTAPQPPDVYPLRPASPSAKPRFVLQRNTSRTLPATPPRIVLIVADGITIGPDD